MADKTNIIDKVVDELLKKQIQYAMGTESLNETPLERSQRNIRDVLRRVVFHMREATTLWSYILVVLFGTDNEHLILNPLKIKMHSQEPKLEPEIRDDAQDTIREEAAERNQLLIEKQMFEQISKHLDEIMAINKEAEEYLAQEWDLNNTIAQQLLVNIPLNALEHENQIRAAENELDQHHFNSHEIEIHLGPQSKPEYAKEIQQENVRGQVKQNYNRLVSELRDLVFGTKLHYRGHANPAISKEMEAMLDRQARSFAFVAALYGAHSTQQAIPEISRTQKHVADVFIDLMNKHRIPDMYKRMQIQDNMLNDLAALRQQQPTGQVKTATDSIVEFVVSAAANQKDLTMRSKGNPL